MVFIASFDIGKKNFAFCIEEVDLNLFKKIKPIPVKSRYKENGTCTEAMEKVLEKVYENGKLILHKNLDLTANCDSKLKLDPETFHNMNEELDKYKEYWEKCDIILIEEQMRFGKKLNMMAVKLAQHCYSYFTFNYGRFKIIVEFPAYHKTQVLGAPKVEGKPYKSGKKRYKAMEKNPRKDWSVEKCIEILTSRGEIDIIEKMTEKKGRKKRKLDDLADVVVQLQAFKFRTFVEGI